ncbi:Putative ribonuclease H protein At1g65750 [Linum perenne]
MERLSHQINEAVRREEWVPISLVAGGPQISHLFYADDLLLFSQADVEHASAIGRCLAEFGAASGLEVSKDKSSIFCSKNTTRDLAALVSSTLNFPLTQDLGRYLGVPVLHGRTTRGTYQPIIDKLDNKLSGWKAKSLSLAGRVTLAKSALSAIPAYVMQTTVLPATTCEAIDKRIRDFVWGSTSEERKSHLISWEQVCKPKALGGLGLRLARELNVAYLVKLAFCFFQRSEVLWVRVLQSKYFWETATELILQIAAMSPPNAANGDDTWVWGCESNGKFSINSAYDLITRPVNPRPLVDWKRIWQWVGPNRVKHFLWLASHGKLLTNAERMRRHMANPFLASTDLNSWIDSLVRHDQALLLGIVCWYLWKARNEEVFTNATQRPQEVGKRALTWTQVVKEAFASEHSILGATPARTRSDVRWDPGGTEAGEVILNTDGSVDPSSGRAAAGGLIRDSLGRCTSAFALNLGSCSITRAEIRGILAGLIMAWDAGFRKVAVQSDSQVAISLLLNGDVPTHHHAGEIMLIRSLLQRDWSVRVAHIYREANKSADFLASLGHDKDLGIHYLDVSDCNLGYFLRLDCMGISEPRTFMIN